MSLSACVSVCLPVPLPHRALEKRTRVEVVTDTCHPCLHNPVRPAILPPSQHYMLTARTELGKGSLLGLYWGDVMTMW